MNISSMTQAKRLLREEALKYPPDNARRGELRRAADGLADLANEEFKRRVRESNMDPNNIAGVPLDV